MKKILFIALALTLALGQVVCFADVQIDEGQQKGTAAVKFFVARNARQTLISADRVVVWDSTSKDGVTVTTTTTSADKLVAGITIDDFSGVSSDEAANSDTSFGNWGRVQTWGLHEDVTTASGGAYPAGSAICSSTTAGAAASCTTSTDGTMVGISLETGTGAAGTVDMMVSVD